MSDPQKYNPVYSASDIQKYWKGELSAREMHELELAALEDPFLADALEGMATYDTHQDLHELRERLAVRVSTPTGQPTPVEASIGQPTPVEKPTPIELAPAEAPIPTGQPAPANAKIRPLLSPWIRIAAAVILALGLGWTTYYILNNSTRKAPLAESHPAYEPAHKNAPSPAAPATTADNKAPATASSAITDSVSTTSPAVAANRKASPPSKRSIQAAKADGGTDYLKQVPADSGAVAFESNTLVDKEKAIAAKDKAVVTERKTFGFSPDSATSRQFIGRAAPAANGYYSFKRASPVTFSGKVLDENNNPLAGASLVVKGTTYNGTQTDKNGLFSLRFIPMPKDSIANRMLTVSYKGYEQASIDMSTLSSEQVFGNIIHLQPQGFALNEVVVTGYGAKRKETLAEAPSASEVSIDSLGLRAAPVEGRTIYRAYLETAKKNLSVDTTIKGTEIISFEVNRKGELSAFKIEQSLSPAHDAGVIRMIKEGPAWHLIKGRTTRAAVGVSF